MLVIWNKDITIWFNNNDNNNKSDNTSRIMDVYTIYINITRNQITYSIFLKCTYLSSGSHDE